VVRVASLSFGDFFAATTLYHQVQWLLFFRDRGRGLAASSRPRDARSLWRRIAAVHAVPAAAGGAILLFAPGSLLYVAVFSPSVYLFFASLHVAQTALVRVLPAAPVGASASHRATA